MLAIEKDERFTVDFRDLFDCSPENGFLFLVNRQFGGQAIRGFSGVLEALQRFKDDPLFAAPGTKWHYTTYGYVLAGAAMEGASGQDFLSYMHNKVFVPLAMQDTVADESDKIIPNRARWYVQTSNGSYRNVPYEDLSYKWAGGGFLSTAEDLRCSNRDS